MDRRAGALPGLVVLLMTTALVATCGGPGPTPGPSDAALSPGTSSAPGQPGGPAPTGQPAGWTAVDLVPLARVATLTPTRSAAAGVAPDTSFRLTSLGGGNPVELASRLVVEPALELRVGEVRGDTVALTPTKPLREGQLYRFTLRGTDPGITEAAWAVQTVKPLHVVTSIPYHEATDVPRDTGIEITFDQDGVALDDARRHIDIAPTTAGRFEQHGRTVVFVPDKPLRKSRIYTVTVRAGLPLSGTRMQLDRKVVIQFETAGASPGTLHMSLARRLYDASTSELAVITLELYDEGEDGEDETATNRRASLAVHRLAGLQAAIRALDAVGSAPDWARQPAQAPVDTSNLPRVLSGKLRIGDQDGTAWVQLPDRLRAGWYLVTVTVEGITRQAVLQVSDLAAFARVTSTRTAVWVNDVRSGDPVRGATADLGGRRLGRTGRGGLLLAATPAAIVKAAEEGRDTHLLVRSGKRSVFVPVTAEGMCEKCWDGGEGYGSADATDRWWQVFSSDRWRYRTSDTVNAWGVVRKRSDRAVPASVTIELFVQDWSATRDVPVATTTAAPDRTGSFAARLPFKSLPAGSYVLRLRVGRDTVSETGISVGSIVKPAWRLSLQTDRHAAISGEPVKATLDAAFFEGTPVAGAEMRLGGGGAYYEGDQVYFEEGEVSTLVTTDGAGSATATIRLRTEDGEDEEAWGEGQVDVQSVLARPTAPEEGDIWGGSEVAVFPASALVNVRGTLDGTRLTIEGSVNDVAFERYEAPGLVSLWDVDPVGAARRGAEVRVHVVEHTTVLREAGTRYDFITKRVEPMYEVEEQTEDLGTRRAVTGADGTYHLTIRVTGGERRSYSLAATYTDEAGRSVHSRTYADSIEAQDDGEGLNLATPDGEDREYAVGDSVRLVVRGGTDGVPVSRYLYLVERQGLRDATVSTSRRFTTPFGAADVPNLYVMAVRFVGTGYESAYGSYEARFGAADRVLAVDLRPDRSSYAPGDRAIVAIRTTDRAGEPRAASVYVRVLDERLYAIHGADDVDPLDTLYASVGSGVLATAWSHQSPLEGDGFGDTGGGDGGGERSDFRDWLAAEIVTTGADGRGSLSVQLSDDLTSWRVVGQAVDAKLRAGMGTAPIVVSLPLFVEANVAAEYLAADRPVLLARAYGTSLAKTDRVTFRVSSDTLPMAEMTATASAFQPVEVPLPALSVGEHRVRIVATTGSGASKRQDVLVRTFRVVDTRTVQGRTTWGPLTTDMAIEGGLGFTTVTLADAGRGRVVPALESLAWGTPDRADRAIAAAVASDLLRDVFGIDLGAASPEPDLDRFQESGGVGVVPWGGADLELSVLAALSGDPRIDRGQLHELFADGASESDEEDNPIEETRERALLRLAGQAALGEPVLSSVRAAARLPDLEPGERITLSLAALAAGDEDLAAELERGLLEQFGQRFGTQVRIHGVKGVPDAVATARVAIVAASLGDPIAADMDAYVEGNPPAETTVDLERAIAARGWVARVPGANATAAVTIGGKRSDVTVTPDRPVRYRLTPDQVLGMRLEPVRGKVLVITTGEQPLDPGSLTEPEGVSVDRTVTPEGTIGSTDAVAVTFVVRVDRELDGECWRLTDFAPSGLVPIDGGRIVVEDEEEMSSPSADEYPSRVEGQRVDFCVGFNAQQTVHTLRYLARVVTPGTYRWEAAILQSTLAPDQGIVLAPFEATIAGPGS